MGTCTLGYTSPKIVDAPVEAFHTKPALCFRLETEQLASTALPVYSKSLVKTCKVL